MLQRVVLILLVLFVPACNSNGDDGEASPVSPAATASTNDGVDRRSGIAEVDRVLEILGAGDMTEIRALLVETPRPCTVGPREIVNPPRCPEGVPAGTMVPVFRALAGDVVWPDDLDHLLSAWATRPRSVYAVYRGAVGNHWLPGAEHAVVLKDEQSGSGDVVHVSGGRIVAWVFAESRTPETLVQGVAANRYVLPPP